LDVADVDVDAAADDDVVVLTVQGEYATNS